jgi:MYXO-CTERM domain-containing protein
VKRPIATAAVLVLAVAGAPPAARGPRPPATGWDLFAVDAWLGAFSDSLPAPGLEEELAPLDASRPPAATPEPTALVLGAAGLAGLAAGRRRRVLR